MCRGQASESPNGARHGMRWQHVIDRCNMRQSAVDALDDSHDSQFTAIVRRARARRAKSADHKTVGGEGYS